MFASLALLAAAQSPVFTLPLGKPPKQIEQPRAPVEIAGPEFDAICDDNDDWDKPAPPVRIHANTYLVGTCGISAILITGSEGHILIDGGTEAGADLIAQNIRALGYRSMPMRSASSAPISAICARPDHPMARRPSSMRCSVTRRSPPIR